jgi:hypothetical protein
MDQIKLLLLKIQDNSLWALLQMHPNEKRPGQKHVPEYQHYPTLAVTEKRS